MTDQVCQIHEDDRSPRSRDDTPKRSCELDVVERQVDKVLHDVISGLAISQGERCEVGNLLSLNDVAHSMYTSTLKGLTVLTKRPSCFTLTRRCTLRNFTFALHSRCMHLSNCRSQTTKCIQTRHTHIRR